MDAARALREIAFWLERAGAPTYRVRAFRRAAAVVDQLPDLEERVAAGRLTALEGIGRTTAAVIEEAHRGRTPAYLAKLRSEVDVPER
ncbi:PHP domain-containing protein, partial [Saccharopolyspora kobensis]